MIYYTEIMGPNAERTIHNTAIAHEGYAKYLATTENAGHLPYIASSFIIAASLRTLFDVERAIALFTLAADNYQKDENPYWKIAAICARDVRRFSESEFELIYEEPYSLAEFLADQFIYKSSKPGQYHQKNELYRLLPAGRLGIPLIMFDEAFAEINAHGLIDSRLPKCSALLIRAGEAPKTMFGNRSEWRHISASFLPFEPEILAACICMLRIAEQRLADYSSIEDKIDADPISLLPLKAAIELYSIPPDSLGRYRDRDLETDSDLNTVTE